MKIKTLTISAAFIWAIGLGGCGSGPSGPTIAGGNPAAPPAPPAEVPALRFPDSLSEEFDISKVAAAGTGELPALEIGDDISGEISDTATNFIFLAGLVDEILAPLHQLFIPRSPEITEFEDLIVLGENLVNVKIDFSPYDEDGNGLLDENCSGNTAALPICYRIWFNGKRALSGIFLNSIPTDDNSGDGRFRGLPTVKLLGVIPFVASVDYDVRDPNDKRAEYFVGVKPDVQGGEPFQEIPTKLSDLGTTLHLTVAQSGPEESALKSISGSIERIGGGGGKESHIGRWREDDDFWSGSRDLSGIDLDFKAACAKISTGLVVDSLECVDRGIDVTDVDFLDFLTIADIAFPADFPTTPEF